MAEASRKLRSVQRVRLLTTVNGAGSTPRLPGLKPCSVTHMTLSAYKTGIVTYLPHRVAGGDCDDFIRMKCWAPDTQFASIGYPAIYGGRNFKYLYVFDLLIQRIEICPSEVLMQGRKDGWLCLHDYVITEELRAAECPLAGHVLNKP